MATSSPSLSNNGFSAAVTPPKTLRGLNKPKCIQCGNVARSRCPFQSCKGCCSRAENPCPIHVLKGVVTSAEKTAPSTPSSEQKASEGTPGRVSSIRQLSSNFAQFNNLNAVSRQRKPLTIKDAQALNEWRFTKLKEYRNRNIEVENDAFDRYMINVNLLEEAFSLASVPEEEETAASERNNEERTVSELKLRLRSNSATAEGFKMRITETVKAGLVKVQKPGGKSDDQDYIKRRIKSRRLEEKTSALNEIIDKLNKARTEEDLKSCVEMRSKLCGNVSSSSASDKNRIFPPSVHKVEISEEALQKMGEQLQSFDQVETL
ncbi:uncharacterized protein LOC111213789 [Brassica napus]|uniref:Uncharacterized protein n=1 Tax=Brassica oleracea var. oleracea TaxID=109376 RepID=A0A0D3CDT2_BRAOL|nr:PREDICTED: uncharacterized protein LOC106292608 [Brassica oleracea var. oleracea]XP_022571349.1 uncharacterized protein LOC111213789 [Brassica napus]